MIEVFINGEIFNFVSKVDPSVKTDYFYDVKTLDGRKHRKFKGKKTGYNVVFYNNLSNDFVRLQSILMGNQTVKFKVDKNAKEYDFYPEIKSFGVRGILNNGKMFFDGLSVTFEKVDYDE